MSMIYRLITLPFFKDKLYSHTFMWPKAVEFNEEASNQPNLSSCQILTFFF